MTAFRNKINFIRTLLSVILLLLLTTSCQQKDNYEKLKLRIMAFGTWVDVTLYDKDLSRYPDLSTSIENSLLQMHRHWHAWHPSAITRINDACAKGKSITISQQMVDLLTLGKQMAERSQGYFQPAIGQLLALWGFQRDDPFNNQSVPPSETIKQIVDSHPSMSQITIKDGELSCSNPQVMLDLGGFGKGFGLELLKKQLLDRGISNMLLNAGGDIISYGKAGNRPWVVGIRNPFADNVLATLELSQNETVFTSGNYERGFIINGKRYHHIINPFNGYPSSGIASATVIGDNGAWSDAAATTMLLAGVEKAFELATDMGVKHLLIITDEGQYYLDQGMLDLLTFIDGRPQNLNILEFNHKGNRR